MTTISRPRTPDTGARPGGIGALAAAGTFVVGIGLFATTLADYATGDPTPAESVDFLVGHQGTLAAWHALIFLAFGVALLPLVRALRQRLVDVEPGLADTGAVLGYVWIGLMFATGMVANIGIDVVADLAESDPGRAASVWASLDAVTDGLGGGNELVGGLWVLLVSIAAWRHDLLPRGLSVLGAVCGAAALVTLVPGLSGVGIVFGLGLIPWFGWIGATLLRGDRGVERARV